MPRHVARKAAFCAQAAETGSREQPPFLGRDFRSERTGHPSLFGAGEQVLWHVSGPASPSVFPAWVGLGAGGCASAGTLARPPSDPAGGGLLVASKPRSGKGPREAVQVTGLGERGCWPDRGPVRVRRRSPQDARVSAGPPVTESQKVPVEGSRGKFHAAAFYLHLRLSAIPTERAGLLHRPSPLRTHGIQ